MSEVINNREYRKTVIKEILMDLHKGKSLEEARAKFAETFDGVASSEIAAAEQALIADGVTVEEVQKLCDVHSALFEDALQEGETTVSAANAADRPGHPVHTLKLENRAVEKLVAGRVQPAIEAFVKSSDGKARTELKESLIKLSDIKLHYKRKENMIFPHMEKHDITAPPKVMWAVDDEIRAGITASLDLVSDEGADRQKAAESVKGILTKINEMIFKEENIMIPMVLEVFTQDEWASIAAESDEIGYTFIDNPPAFRISESSAPASPEKLASGSIVFPTGAMRIDELIGIFNTLPMDITFVDKDETVKYFSQGAERIFPRTKSVIGRKVVNCHPPASVHIVEGILNDFKTGKKTHEDFWIKMGDKTVYIRYFAVHDEKGEFLGTLEVTQNIAPIQALSGEKRLVEHP